MIYRLICDNFWEIMAASDLTVISQLFDLEKQKMFDYKYFNILVIMGDY